MLAEALSGTSGHEVQALIVHIQNQTLGDTIEALAEGYGEETISHVRHFRRGFGSLAGWRNFYAHALHGIDTREGEAVGFTSEVDVKSRALRARESVVMRAELENCRHQMLEFGSYGSAIISHVQGLNGLALLAYEPLASSETPALPSDPLRGFLYYPLRNQPPPQSSQE